MPEHKPFLPPHIGKWLASEKPELLAKAEATLRAAEPDANDLLLEQIGRDGTNAFALAVAVLCFSAVPFNALTQYGSRISVRRVCLGVLLMLPQLFIGSRFLVVPITRRFSAAALTLARRGDVRALPYLLPSWPSRVVSKKSIETDAALLAVLRKAEPGTVPFSRGCNTKDKFALLRARFDALLVKRKGEFEFRSASIATPDKVRIWLALLAHLATDPNAKGRVLLLRVANANTSTLDEEVVRNTARALLDGIPVETVGEPAINATATPAPLETWKPTETSETPALLQRLGGR